MDVAGKVNRAFAVNGVPSSRVCAAEKLNFQAITRGGLGGFLTNHLLGGLPCGATGRPPLYGYALNFAVDNVGIHLRCAETLFIASQATRPGKAASGGRSDNARSGMLFAGCNYRDTLVGTESGQVKG